MTLATVDVVVPVYNEEAALPGSIERLTEYLAGHLPNPWRVTIADNASTDGTRAVSQELSNIFPNVHYYHLPQKGRGRALRAVWLASDSDIVSYMDVDLSTDLNHFPQLVEALESGYHVAVGSRLSRESRGYPRPKTGVHFPQLQRADQVAVLHSLPGCSVRVQGADPAGGPGHHTRH